MQFSYVMTNAWWGLDNSLWIFEEYMAKKGGKIFEVVNIMKHFPKERSGCGRVSQRDGVEASLQGTFKTRLDETVLNEQSCTE